MKAKLSRLADDLTMVSQEATVYYDRETGECCRITDEEMAIVEGASDGDEDGYADDEEFVQLKAIYDDDDGTRYVAFPSQYDINEWEVMRQFIESLDNAKHMTALSRAIHGSKAFRRFKDEARYLGIDKDWFAFRDVWYRDLMREWCKENNVEYEE